MSILGARLIRDTDTLLKILEEPLCTVEGLPSSARFVPDDDRWKDGCGGLLGARDMREEETDLAWPEVAGGFSLMFEIEFDLFRADAGCGIAELKLILPNV